MFMNFPWSENTKDSQLQDFIKNHPEAFKSKFGEVPKNSDGTMNLDEAMRIARLFRDSTAPKNSIQNNASGFQVTAPIQTNSFEAELSAKEDAFVNRVAASANQKRRGGATQGMIGNLPNDNSFKANNSAIDAGLDAYDARQEQEFNEFKNAMQNRGSSQYQNLICDRSEGILKETSIRMTRGLLFNDALSNAVDNLLNNLESNDAKGRMDILAAKFEVTNYVANATRETGYSESFFVNMYNARR